MAFQAGRVDEAVSIANHAVPLSERIGHWGNAFFCRDVVYNARFLAGEFDCAGEAAAMVDEYERLHFNAWTVKLKADLANVARLRGRIEEAEEWCRRAVIIEGNHWGGIAHAVLTLAQAGDPRFEQALQAALPFAPQAGHPAPFGRWPTLNVLVEAVATAGRLDATAALLPAAEDMLTHGFVVFWAGHALPLATAGIAAACARQWLRAEQHHRAAIHLADTLPVQVCQPIARYWYAEMLCGRREAGDLEHASVQLQAARGMFDSLAMPFGSRLTERRLAHLPE
jgi:hypothetical protein